ncbi:unnamed protein product [Caenorhabditis bovis]|uniref:Uncharacterized protein n=1 Tax=Caenorhabditis bovis TaxID=2654633 RepID=A0A8S1F4C3_9PELO|nr:unnamed protein product [Caenorhabditis bovis]
MGYLLTISCYLLSFSASLVIFVAFILHDPVRIILFFLGAFFWLLSLLLSSVFWFALSPIFSDPFHPTLLLSIIFQEVARVAYFWVLKKAQNGLNKITRQTNYSMASGVSGLQNSRHMLALVCGLGMGVTSALFFVMNAFATFAGPGSIGLPEALEKGTADVNRAGKMLPLFLSLSALLLTLFHVTWTIMIWDTCHKIGRSTTVFNPAIVAIGSHFLIVGISAFSSHGFYAFTLFLQSLILLVTIVYCHVILGGTVKNFALCVTDAVQDALTLRFVRSRFGLCSRGAIRVPDEPLTERNAIRS